MDAVIVAGGLGSRAWPLATRRPKHLLSVAGLPFLAHQVAKLAACGVDHVVLATSYRAEQFAPELGDGAALGVRLTYVTEDEPLGTGGAIRNVAHVLEADPDDPVVVVNGDQLSGHDLAAQVDQWRAADADVSLQLVDVPDPAAYGSVPTDADGRVTAFLEKQQGSVSGQVNAGCYVFRRSVISKIPPHQAVSVERETFPALLREGLVLVGYLEPCYWLDVGSPSALARASRDLVTGEVTSPAYTRAPGRRLVHADAWVDPAADIRGGSCVDPHAMVGPDSIVAGSLVLRGATVSDGAQVTDSVIGPGATVGASTVLRDAAVGDDAVVGDGCELLSGARVACDARLEAGTLRFSAP